MTPTADVLVWRAADADRPQLRPIFHEVTAANDDQGLVDLLIMYYAL